MKLLPWENDIEGIMKIPTLISPVVVLPELVMLIEVTDSKRESEKS
jgi:hypothetical protein